MSFRELLLTSSGIILVESGNAVPGGGGVPLPSCDKWWFHTNNTHLSCIEVLIDFWRSIQSTTDTAAQSSDSARKWVKKLHDNTTYGRAAARSHLPYYRHALSYAECGIQENNRAFFPPWETFLGSILMAHKRPRCCVAMVGAAHAGLECRICCLSISASSKRIRGEGLGSLPLFTCQCIELPKVRILLEFWNGRGQWQCKDFMLLLGC